MFQMNSEKSVRIIGISAFFLILYSGYFDYHYLKIPLSLEYVLQKTFFMLFIPILSIFFKNINVDKRVFIISMTFSTYVIIQTYFYAINYMIASIQLMVIFTSMLYLEKREFFIFYGYLTTFTLLAIIYTDSPYGFSQYGDEIRSIYIDDFLSLQATTGLVYALITYPRLKKLKEDMKFSNFGKASSFILHEMQKPMNRLNMTVHENDDLNSLRKTLEIAKKLQQGSINEAKIETISLEKIAAEVMIKYNEFLDFYKIKITFDLAHSKFKSDHELITLIFDNLIRNAIEANKENELENRWLTVSSRDNGFNIINPFTKMIAETELFTPLKSSKIGNMGTGLHFCKTITEGLDHKIKVKCKNNVFEAQFEF